MEAAAVKDALFRGHAGGEEAGEDSAQGTADAMDRDGAHRVINLGDLIEKNSTASTMTRPKTMPITAAPRGDTASHPAVMPTRPARAAL